MLSAGVLYCFYCFKINFTHTNSLIRAEICGQRYLVDQGSHNKFYNEHRVNTILFYTKTCECSDYQNIFIWGACLNFRAFLRTKRSKRWPGMDPINWRSLCKLGTLWNLPGTYLLDFLCCYGSVQLCALAHSLWRWWPQDATHTIMYIVVYSSRVYLFHN